MAEATRYWWVLLVSGALWVLVSLAILQFDLRSVWSIAILTGALLIAAAVMEFGLAGMAPVWGWAHALLGVFFLAGGIAAFVWPTETFLVLARLIGWYLLFLGAFEVADSVAARRTDLWWLRLIAGVAAIAVAFWAVESLNRSATLLVLWIGLGALLRGLSHIFLAFEYRHLHEGAKAVASATRQADGRPQAPTVTHTGI